MNRSLVKNWMTQEVITIHPDTSLSDAHHLMTTYKIRRLPVVNDHRLVGIITLGDVREAEPSHATSLSVWEINYLLDKLKIEKIMTRDPITISEDATVGEAARVMLEAKISGLVVVDESNRIVGIITESDIFRLVVQEWDKAESFLVAV